MSKFLPLQRRIFEMIGKKILIPKDPMTAVAKGAALYSLFKDAEVHNTYGEDDLLPIVEFSVNFKNKMDDAYLIGVKDQLPKVLIEKNELYPVKKVIKKGFNINTPHGVTIYLYKGTSKYSSDLKKAGTKKCDFNGNFRDEGTYFDIEYEIDENGILSFKVVFDDGESYEFNN